LHENEAVVNPRKTMNSPDLGPVAVMVATRLDLEQLCRLLKLTGDRYQRLFLSRLYLDRHPAGRFSVVGPLVGAPYAVMLLENLVAWGARRIIFIGWCGGISDGVRIGDIVLPTAAVIDEGTSKHYGARDTGVYKANFPLVSGLRQLLENRDHDFHEGTVWTTDALYRETRRDVAAHRDNGVLAVDMEISALFSAAAFREVDLAGLLVVSDELSSLNWRPGFKDKRFKQSLTAVRELMAQALSDSVL
jgi:purine-nucleoside phosphorylase